MIILTLQIRKQRIRQIWKPSLRPHKESKSKMCLALYITSHDFLQQIIHKLKMKRIYDSFFFI